MRSDDGEPPSPAAVDVDGRSVRCVLDGIDRYTDGTAGATATTVIGVDDVRDGEWYSLAVLVEAIENLAADAGCETAADVGRAFAASLTFAGEASTVPDALTALDDSHRDRHRGDAGGFTFRQIGATDGRVECHTPYPCAFDRGLVDGVAAAHADGFVCLSEVGRCRNDGGDRCTYELTW